MMVILMMIISFNRIVMMTIITMRMRMIMLIMMIT